MACHAKIANVNKKTLGIFLLMAPMVSIHSSLRENDEFDIVGALLVCWGIGQLMRFAAVAQHIEVGELNSKQ